MFRAVTIGNFNITSCLLSKNVSPNLRGITPLFIASEKGHLDIVKLLIDKGADVHAKDTFGKTALNLASQRLEIVKLLIEKGAEVNAKTKKGLTALVCAGGTQKHEIIKVLLENKANVDVQNTSKNTALHLAARVGKEETVKLLLAYGADVSIKNKRGQTALDVAKNETIKQILLNPIEPEITGNIFVIV